MKKIQQLLMCLKPYADVIRFMAVLLVGNALWKLTFHGDEAGNYITFLGFDLTHFFSIASSHVAKASYVLVHAIEDSAQLLYGHIIRFSNDVTISVVWGCSAVKQGLLFTLIMLMARGPWLRKLWFIPLGWLMVYLFNIMRIAIIALLIHHHPTWFEFLHTYLFKYLFYGMIFALWVVWTERLSCVHTEECVQTNESGH
jgi:exosortase/archaeosortase family protein